MDDTRDLNILQEGTPELAFRGVFNCTNRLGQLCAYYAPRAVIESELKLIQRRVEQALELLAANPNWQVSPELLPPPDAYDVLLKESSKVYG